jgi:hypothetical protein
MFGSAEDAWQPVYQGTAFSLRKELILGGAALQRCDKAFLSIVGFSH